MLRGRYGIGWMLTAWFALVLLAMTIALWAGPEIGRMVSAS